MSDFTNVLISSPKAEEIAQKHYQINGVATALPGEVDFNFRIDDKATSYLLKVSRPEPDLDFIEFQNEILRHISARPKNRTTKLIQNLSGAYLTEIKDDQGFKRIVRLLTWIEGRLWSSVNPQKEELLFSLGEQAASVTKSLQNFDHPMAHRKFQWDINQAEWTFDSIDLLDKKQKQIVSFFQKKYLIIQDRYQLLRKSVIHNDINDNNIIASKNLTAPTINAIIDFGDAIYTQQINELAVTIAYAVMNKTDVIEAAIPLIKGYNNQLPLLEEELELLYTLVAMRLVVSVCKSALNKKNEPENTYLQVSEKQAWDVLEKWMQLNENLATYQFRKACNFCAHPKTTAFKEWAKNQSLGLSDLFPTINKTKCHKLDLGMQSYFLGHSSEFNDPEQFEFKISQLQKQFPKQILAGGYLETRPIYTTDEYKKEGNNGSEYRTIHLGIDFWLHAHTPVHALFDGTVILATNDTGYKEYGGLIIIEHEIQDLKFYSLFGHQSLKSIERLKKGDKIKKGEFISEVGTFDENGNWGTHLHFQIILDMLGNVDEFPGVCYPQQKNVWADICPDPNLLFKDTGLKDDLAVATSEMINYRKKHLGKSLSLSYNEALHIVRGEGAYLVNSTGRKYLDTVNNVAHVGHEHYRIAQAAKNQIAQLNTNTRYLHNNINDFAEALLDTFPDKLSVVHFVNSGSEANELALRMVKSFTGHRDMIALEAGYHGNTNACVDVSSYKFDGKGGRGAPEQVHIVPLPDTFRGLYRGTDTSTKYAAFIHDHIDNIESKSRKLAAFICESIVSCGGQIELPKDFLKMAYNAVRNAGGLCIADEVQTGCGRIGSHFWGFQQHNVIPDIVTIGKPIGNGHPLAAVICTREVADAFANGMEYFNTYGGNPVSSAIGLEVLQVIKDERLQKNALTIGKYLKESLFELQKAFPIIGDVRGRGLFLGFELTDKNLEPLGAHAAYLANRMKELGILMSTDGKDENVMKIKPPMIFSKENADELIYRLKKVLAEDFMSEF